MRHLAKEAFVPHGEQQLELRVWCGPADWGRSAAALSTTDIVVFDPALTDCDACTIARWEALHQMRRPSPFDAARAGRELAEAGHA